MDDLSIVIPARLKSSRIHEKMLQRIKGVPLILHTVRAASPLEKFGAKIIVATDSKEIARVCQDQSIAVHLSEEARSGTDRVFLAAIEEGRGKVINLQGDEPFVHPDDLAKLYECIPNDGMATLFQMSDRGLSRDVCRIMIDGSLARAGGEDGEGQVMEHLGVAGFTLEFLEYYSLTPPTPREVEHNNEYNRIIDMGYNIVYIESSVDCVSINTPEDLVAARRRLGVLL